MRINNWLDYLDNHEGFKFLMNEQLKEITNSYYRIANGSKETFDFEKGRLMGLNFLINLMESYRSKKKTYAVQK